MIDTDALMAGAIARYQNHAKWGGAKFAGIKIVSNSHVGCVGQDFIEDLCVALALPHQFPLLANGKRNTNSPWDVRILGKEFELKTATEDVSGCFQFNHIRHHRPYDGIICVGVAPDSVLFECYSKGDIATGKAGNLVTMDKGSSATFKLTKRKTALRSIDLFEARLRELVSSL